MKSKKIIFIHVPKCGGTSLNAAFAKHFDLDKTARISSSQSLAIAKTLNQSLSLIRQILLSDLLMNGDYDYISGHVHFNFKIYQRFCDRYSFITILRDPVERWISLYFYNKFKNSHHCRIFLDLEDFLETEEAKRQGNIYNTYFENVNFLRYFEAVTFLNNSTEMTQLLKNRTKLEIKLPKLNQNPKSSDFIKTIITEDLYRKIENICLPDINFYKQAQDFIR